MEKIGIQNIVIHGQCKTLQPILYVLNTDIYLHHSCKKFKTGFISFASIMDHSPLLSPKMFFQSESFSITLLFSSPTNKTIGPWLQNVVRASLTPECHAVHASKVIPFPLSCPPTKTNDHTKGTHTTHR